MKRYYVTVNGKRYEVEIEEVKGEFSPRASVATTANAEAPQAPVPAPAQVEAPEPVEKKEVVEEKSQPQPAAANAEGEKIECPMPGTILKVNINPGDQVKKGDVLFILEAMKMENEIMAARDGKIVQVAIAKGTAVNTGDLLAVIQ
ncbi:biotin/lipoyl-containing protein [Desnuesiella massiliensis]|uniref:biotin/lipoyl-containing protein n=1 Tax=Desnuesiella massiliensis TaxID=1650662 RepID=UPI0006E24062|nr:biotin/lipoyl-containing protein [Desnuesiella massiliensis]